MATVVIGPATTFEYPGIPLVGCVVLTDPVGLELCEVTIAADPAATVGAALATVWGPESS